MNPIDIFFRTTFENIIRRIYRDVRRPALAYVRQKEPTVVNQTIDIANNNENLVGCYMSHESGKSEIEKLHKNACVAAANQHTVPAETNSLTCLS